LLKTKFVLFFKGAYISPAQLADNRLGGFVQVRRVLDYPVQDLGVDLLWLGAGEGRAGYRGACSRGVL